MQGTWDTQNAENFPSVSSLLEGKEGEDMPFTPVEGLELEKGGGGEEAGGSGQGEGKADTAVEEQAPAPKSKRRDFVEMEGTLRRLADVLERRAPEEERAYQDYKRFMEASPEEQRKWLQEAQQRADVDNPLPYREFATREEVDKFHEYATDNERFLFRLTKDMLDYLTNAVGMIHSSQRELERSLKESSSATEEIIVESEARRLRGEMERVAKAHELDAEGKRALHSFWRDHPEVDDIAERMGRSPFEVAYQLSFFERERERAEQDAYSKLDQRRQRTQQRRPTGADRGKKTLPTTSPTGTWDDETFEKIANQAAIEVGWNVRPLPSSII